MEKVKENNEKRDFIIIAGIVVIVVCLNTLVNRQDGAYLCTYDPMIVVVVNVQHKISGWLPQKNT